VTGSEAGLSLAGADQKDARTGVGYCQGGLPGERGQGVGVGSLAGAYEEGEAAGGGYQVGGGGEDGFEVFDGAEGDYVESSVQGLGAGGLYIDVRQCKGAGDFAEEGGFLVVGFD